MPPSVAKFATIFSETLDTADLSQWFSTGGSGEGLGLLLIFAI